jgi:tetratricopeptide (TPR) repeat protein
MAGSRVTIDMRNALVLVLVVGTVGIAHAGKALPVLEQKRVALSKITALEVDGRLWAVRGKLRVPLSGDAFVGGGNGYHSLTHATQDGTAFTVEYLDFCGVVPHTITFTSDDVEARFENAAALALHRKKQYVEAAEGFSKALALAPAFVLARENLASAQALAGKPEDAVATLAPLLSTAPLATYLQIFSDPELASVREAALVRAQRATTPGTATAATLEKLAYAPERRMFAARVPADCGFSGMSGEDVTFVAAGGSMLATLPLAACGEVDPVSGKRLARARAAIAQRAQRIDRVLADFGFSEPHDLDPQAAVDFRKVRLPREKLGIVLSQTSTIRVLRDNAMLAEQPTLAERVQWATYVPAAKAIVYGWSRDEPEAECGNLPPYIGIDAINVP